MSSDRGATNISSCCCRKNKLPDGWVAAASPKHNRKRSASGCRTELFRVPWRTMSLWDATPHLRFSISSWQLHIYDGGRYKQLQGGGCVHCFDVGDEEQSCCAIRSSNEVPTKMGVGTILMVDLFGASSTSGGARESSGMLYAAT
jgi:hypothetical protein